MLLNARQPRNTTSEVTGAEKALRRRKTLSAQPQGSISKDRCGSEELGENTDRFGTTHKDFPPTQSFQKTDAAQRSWVKTRTDLEPLIRTSLPPNEEERPFPLSLRAAFQKTDAAQRSWVKNTDRFGTTHKDFPPTQSERRPEFAPQVGFFDKKSIRDDLRTDSRYIMYLYVYIKLYFWKYISYCEMETLKKKKK